MPLMKAMQISKPGGDFELVQKEIPAPKENEVRLKVQACGICHGDAVVKEGHFPGIQYPRVPGHEVVGIVDKSGPHVSRWQVGQRVGVGWFGGPCMKCDACKMGDFTNCRSALTTGISFDGGYAEYMVAPQQAMTLIPDELKSLEAAPLLCAGRTIFSALRNSKARGGDTVAIQGLGGLGHLGIQFAKKLGFRTVAISRGKDKQELAYKLGAHVYIDTESTNAVKELQKIGGAKVIVSTAPNSKAITDVIGGLGFDGQLIIVSAPGDPLVIPPGSLLWGRHAVQGWVARSTGDKSEDAINFSVLTGTLPVIEVFPLEQAPQAYEKMMTAKVHFRAVLKMSE